MTYNKLNIRYVHATNFFNTDRCPYSGITIAYVRNHRDVKFAYALCLKGDQYIKEVGRKITSRNLVSNLSALENLVDAVFLNTKDRVGITNALPFRNSVAHMDILADNIVDNLSMLDFKHKTISNFLIGMVYQGAVFDKYPNSRS